MLLIEFFSFLASSTALGSREIARSLQLESEMKNYAFSSSQPASHLIFYEFVYIFRRKKVSLKINLFTMPFDTLCCSSSESD